MVYTERIGIRATRETVDKIRALQGIEDSISDVVREAIDFYFNYNEGLKLLFEKE